MPDPSHQVWPQHHIPAPTNSLPLTEVSRVVVGGAVQAKPLQIGDQVGDHALEDALTLAQDVELSRKKKDEENKTSGPGRLHHTSFDSLHSSYHTPIIFEDQRHSPCQTSQRVWHWAGGWCR